LLREFIELDYRLFELVDLDVHAVKVLVDLGEGPLRQVENSLDVEHLELEVVTVQDVSHVAQV